MTIDDTLLGYKKRIIGIKKVNASEYFCDKYSLTLVEIEQLDEVNRIRLFADLTKVCNRFDDFVVRNGYWFPEPNIDIVKVEDGKIISKSGGKYITDSGHTVDTRHIETIVGESGICDSDPSIFHKMYTLENQLKSPYMRMCPKEWLERCLAHNAIKYLSNIKQ
ncbi:MAG: hypothetical protein ACLFTR_04225 [Candidatus Woesearchaeota archaeon]